MKQQSIEGRIDENGRVLLPVIVIAADGLEVEVEASVSLQYGGAMAISDELARNLGWRRIGARRVVFGFETVIMDHYLGIMALGNEPHQEVVLSGLKSSALIGHKVLAGRKLTLDFTTSHVLLE